MLEIDKRKVPTIDFYSTIDTFFNKNCLNLIGFSTYNANFDSQVIEISLTN